MKLKTKPERKVKFMISIPESIAQTFDAHRKEGDARGYDWTATVLESMMKTDTEFSEYLTQHPAKTQPQPGTQSGTQVVHQPGTQQGPTTSPKTTSSTSSNQSHP